MQVMIGWTQQTAERWLKMDVTIDATDIRALFLEQGVDIDRYGTLTNNEQYKLMVNEAEKFLLVHQITSVPSEFNTAENKARVKAYADKNREIITATESRPIPERSPWN